MKFKISYFAYLYLLLALFSGLFKNTVAFIIVIIFHELGHIFIIKYLKYPITLISIYPFGGVIKIDKIINTKIIDDVLISLGGFIGQVILFIICLIFKSYINDYFYNLLLLYNKLIFIINGLFIYPFDGFWVLNHLLNYRFSYYGSYIISLVINALSVIIIINYLLYKEIMNIPVIIMILVSIIFLVKKYQELIQKFYLERLYFDFYYRNINYFNKPNKTLIKREVLSYYLHYNEKEIIKNTLR